MSTTAQVRSAWKTKIFDNATIQAITTNNYDRRMEIQGTTSQLKLLKFEQAYNWMEYTVQRFPNGGAIGQRRFEFVVDVKMHRELEPNSDQHKATLDAMDTLSGLVISELGYTWNNTVDRWLDVAAEPTLDEIDVAGKRIVLVAQEFRAEKYI